MNGGMVMNFMKKISITLLFMLFIFIPSEVKAEVFNKEQINIDINKSSINFIGSDGSIATEKCDDGSIFTDTKGLTYISADSLLKILNNNENSFSYNFDGETLYINKNEEHYLKINTDTSVADLCGESKSIQKCIINTDGNVFLPLRDIMNIFGYEDSEIIYQPNLKTISLNKQPLFETDKITVTDFMHCSSESSLSEEYLTYDVLDSQYIQSLISYLNKAPFYSCNVNYRSANPWYKFDFNNGVVLNIDSNCVFRIYKYGNKICEYQIPFELSVQIEKFVKNTIPENEVFHNIWWYDSGSEEDLNKYEYITYDYMDNDYKEITNYIISQVNDFEKRYNFLIENRSEEEVYLIVTQKDVPESEYKVSLRIYKYPGAMKMSRINNFVYALK